MPGVPARLDPCAFLRQARETRVHLLGVLPQLFCRRLFRQEPLGLVVSPAGFLGGLGRGFDSFLQRPGGIADLNGVGNGGARWTALGDGAGFGLGAAAFAAGWAWVAVAAVGLVWAGLVVALIIFGGPYRLMVSIGWDEKNFSLFFEFEYTRAEAKS